VQVYGGSLDMDMASCVKVRTHTYPKAARLRVALAWDLGTVAGRD